MLTDLTPCRVDIREPRIAAQEEVFEHTVQDMRSSRFTSECISNPTLFRPIGGSTVQWRIRRRVDGRTPRAHGCSQGSESILDK